MFYLAGGRGEVVENDDFQEAEAFACIGKKMVCNQRGTRGQEASSVREKQAAPAGQRPNCRQGCDPCPTPPNLAMHCLIGKASFFQPANSGRPPPPPHTQVIFLQTVLSRYNSRTVQFILLQCTIPWFLVYWRSCTAITTVYFRSFSSPRKRRSIFF